MTAPAPEATTNRAQLRADAPRQRRWSLPSLPSLPRPGRDGGVSGVRDGGTAGGPAGDGAGGSAGARAGARLGEAAAKVATVGSASAEQLAERTRPVWSPVAGVLRWVSPLGWAVLALGGLAYGVGVRFGWTEWMMIAGGAFALMVLCLLLAVGRTRVTIVTQVDPVRVTVGEPATGRIEVTNDSPRGMLPLLVELPVGVSAARFTLPPLGAGRAHEELFVVPTHRRGVIPVGPATTVQGDPLGLVRRTLRWTDVTDLYVHPRTVSLESLGAGLLRDLEGEATQDLSMSDLAFHALREYQPGDDRRYIHWRSSAKFGRLLVRQFLDTRRSHLSVVVDADPARFTGGEDAAETAISVAASLALRAIMDEQDMTVICGGERSSRTTGSLTLDALARAEVGARDLFSQTGEAVATAPDTSMAVIVTGARRPFIEVQRALAQFEPEVHKVVINVDADERVGVRRVGGLTLLSIQRLEDLRRVLVSGALT